MHLQSRLYDTKLDPQTIWTPQSWFPIFLTAAFSIYLLFLRRCGLPTLSPQILSLQTRWESAATLSWPWRTDECQLWWVILFFVCMPAPDKFLTPQWLLKLKCYSPLCHNFHIHSSPPLQEHQGMLQRWLMIMFLMIPPPSYFSSSFNCHYSFPSSSLI